MPETSFWLGVLTGGGDCAGINAALRAVTKSLIQEHNASVLAIRDGFRSRNPAIEPSTRAASLVAERRFGKMVALQDGSFTDVPLSTVANARRTVPLGSPSSLRPVP